MGLEIITTLISHEKKEVVASSLGRLYLVIQDECIRKLIVKELKEMKCCNDASLRTSAVESLDIIIGEGIPTFKHILHLGHRQNSK